MKVIVNNMRVKDVALFLRRYQKGLKKQGYKVVKRKFPNKKKRLCYNCGSTEHLIAHCPHEIEYNNYKRDKKEVRPTIKRAKGTWERLTLDMNRTQQKIDQVRRIRRLQP
jgi:multimeric flavodoxin WrbA